MIIVPPYLKKGNSIGITCPAGYMPKENAATCIRTLQSWGYEVMVGKTLGSGSDNYFSGTDEERAGELQAMLDHPGINAIVFGRGGYGMSRIIDRLDFKSFKKNPKWLIGFSDITVMHNHLLRKFNISSMHAPMAAAFNEGNGKNENVLSLQHALKGKKISISCPSHLLNKKGTVTGGLVGGNLALLAHIIGTASDIPTDGKILFIEDVGEYIYNVDRLLLQLKRSGKFKKLKALIVGGFTDMKDTTRPFGKTVEETIKDMTDAFDFPVCFGFPISHGKHNLTLKTGLEYKLSITTSKTTLKEI